MNIEKRKEYKKNYKTARNENRAKKLITTDDKIEFFKKWNFSDNDIEYILENVEHKEKYTKQDIADIVECLNDVDRVRRNIKRTQYRKQIKKEKVKKIVIWTDNEINNFKISFD